MSINQYIESASQSLADLPSINKVVRFGGQFSNDDLDAINLTNTGCTVLITGIGGDIEPNPMCKLDVNGGFAAFVVGSVDRNTVGHSPKASEVAIEVANHIYQNSRLFSGASRTKEVEMIEISERENSTNAAYGIWQVLWSQRITI